MYRLILLVALFVGAHSQCNPTVTTASGTHCSQQLCSGQLFFEDNFDFFDLKKWEHERTLAGGGNWEFQWYDNSRRNSFTRDGLLYIKPSLTSDEIGDGIYYETVDLHGGAPADQCTNPSFYGCSRSGGVDTVINPVKSGRLRTVHSCRFKYGRLEVRARMPAGDWLWPAIWLLPRDNAYSGWPLSGEIDLVETRGNRNLYQAGRNIGTQLMGSTLHWGPDYNNNRYPMTNWERTNPAGFDTDFYNFEMEWTPDYINFFVNGEFTGGVAPPNGGFWELGGFAPQLFNPWQGQDKMAPFNQEFYVLLNNAVGGIAFFPDDASNPQPKPWTNDSPRAASDFWEGRGNWLPTWNLEGSDDAAMRVDYVRIFAL